jgi:hypothetical protein
MLYDKRRHFLAVPAIVPLPLLIARTLTLCTGLVPMKAVLKEKAVSGIPPNCHMYIYRSVPPSIAKAVSEKLGQNLVDYDLEVEADGRII